MLPQQDIDNIIHASRACDEGPTQLARRIESAVEAAERERCANLCEQAAERLRNSGCKHEAAAVESVAEDLRA